MSDPVLWIGATAAALAAATALVSDDDRVRAAAMGAALVLAPVLIAADNWDDQRLRDLRDSPATLAAVSVAGAVLLGAFATLIVRWPAALALLALVALPFRVPVEAGGETSNLLLPLYVVIAAGVLAEVARALPSSLPAHRPLTAARGGAPRWLLFALGAYVVLYAAQGSYSDDFSQALANLAFFFVPFALLAAMLVRLEWTHRLLAVAFAIVVGEAVVFALVGFVEYALWEVIWNPQIMAANEVHSYFRVNSLFWDPNIFGRYLAMSLIVLSAVMLWTHSPRRAGAAALLSLGLLAALAITFSQSSLVALIAGLAALAALRWSVRWTAVASVAAIAAVAVAAALGGGIDLDLASPKRLNVQTSGRVDLVGGGLELAGERPIAGHGSGAFEERFRRRFRSGQTGAAVASHTEPVTVAAEQGAIGLTAYLGVIALALAALSSAIGPLAPGLGRPWRSRGADAARPAGGPVGPSSGATPPGPGTVLAAARAGLLAVAVAMVVHSLSYAAFFTDPITWVLLGIGMALAARGLDGDHRATRARPAPGADGA